MQEKTQREKFEEAARQLETDDSDERFDAIIRRVAKSQPSQRDRPMSDQAGLRRTFVGAVNADEVWAWIDQVLAANKSRKALGIRVSNHLHQMGIAGERNGVKIAMNEHFYPEDTVEIVFE